MADNRTTKPHSYLFTVRLWREELDTAAAPRGSVRDVTGGATRSFRAWSDLTAFFTERMQFPEGARPSSFDQEGDMP